MNKPNRVRPRDVLFTPRRAAALALAVLLGCAPHLFAASATWDQTAGGAYLWNTATNWDPETVPNGAADVASVNNDIFGDQTITLPNAMVELQSMTLGDADGSHSFTLNTGGGSSFIRTGGSIVSTGDNTINVLIDVLGSSTLSLVNSAGDLLVSGNIRPLGNGSTPALSITSEGDTQITGDISIRNNVIKGGIGTLTLSGTNTSAFGAAVPNNTFRQGTLVLDYGTSNSEKLVPAGLLLDGGALNLVLRGGTYSESLSLISRGGETQITRDGGSATLHVTGLSVQDTGAVNFAAGLATTTVANNAAGILSPGATLAGTDFAANVAGAVGAATYQNDDFGNSTNNVNVTATQSAPGSFSVNTLRFDANADLTLSMSGTNTLTAGTGSAILVTPNVGAHDVTITGGILTTANSGEIRIHQYNTDGLLTINAQMSGAGVGVVKFGPGTVRMGGGKNYTGATYIMGGVIEATSIQNRNVASSLGQPGSATAIVLDGGALRYVGRANASTNRPIVLGTGGSTIESSGAGTLSFVQEPGIGYTTAGFYNTTVEFGKYNLTLGGTNTGNNTIDVILANRSAGLTTALTKSGAGKWILSQNNTYSGATTVTEGTLVVNGSTANSATTVHSGATLGGSGSVGSLLVQAGGTHAPGNSPGIQVVSGDYTLDAGANLVIELDGPAPGSAYDRVDVAGLVSIDGANLVIDLGFAPTEGQKFFIIVNDDSDAINGTFAGLADGSEFILGSFGGQVVGAQISYFGDSGSGAFTGGNDVVLLIVPEPATAGLILVAGSLAWSLQRPRRRSSRRQRA